MTRFLLALPLVLFGALAVIFAFRVTDGADRSVVPSALIGKSVPEARFPSLSDALPGVNAATFGDGVKLVNVFASWCGPCRVEHPILMTLSERPEIDIVAINYKDRVLDARAFLTELGNPYTAIGVDPDGRSSIEWGVYGVPETFIVDETGTIRGKHVGPLTEDVMDGEFGQTLEALIEGRAPAAS